MLYIVPTPIGNLKDITLRALEVLKEVDIILAEDTRTSGKLLQHYNITTQLKPYHQHNEHKILTPIIDNLLAGKTMALITDAGTPAISDPGYLLVREALNNNIKVNCLPGATAFVPALVNSGIPCNRFCFEGFLPPKKGRHTMLTQLSTEERTIVLYESPMRLQSTLKEFAEYFGEERRACVSREITKMFEENITDTLQNLYIYFNTKKVKGEIVIIIEGYKKPNKNETKN